MYFRNIPRVTYQCHSEFDESSWHSILISLLRGLAAFIVATAHLRAAMYPAVREVSAPPVWFQGLAFVSGFAHQAVLVFFVISGWLVGGSLLNRISESNVVLNYAIDRVTRLWTVLIPTFLLTLLIALAIGAASPKDINFSADNPYSIASFVGNLVGLQSFLFPDFGGNFPLWSLANETWYYILFPLLAVAYKTSNSVVRMLCVGAILTLGVLLPSSIIGYFLIWLLGVGFSRLRIDCGAGVRWCWIALLFAGAAYFRLTGELDEFVLATLGQDVICSLLYLILLSSLQFKASPLSQLARSLRRVGKFFAEFSFSLYVLHVPMIGLLQHWCASRLGLRQLSPAEPLHTVVYFAMLGILMVTAYCSYLLFESRTYQIRRLLKNIVLNSRLPRLSRHLESAEGQGVKRM